MNIVFQNPKDEGEILRKSITVNKIVVDLQAGTFEVQTLHNDNRTYIIEQDVSEETHDLFNQLLTSLAVDLEAKYSA